MIVTTGTSCNHHNISALVAYFIASIATIYILKIIIVITHYRYFLIL